MRQEKMNGVIQVDEHTQIPAWYYREQFDTISPNLGYELGLIGPTGRRRTIGVLIKNSVVWTTDSQVQTHPDLAAMEGSAILAQFQNNKIPGERLARIYVSSPDLEHLLSLTQHILRSTPNGLLGISLNLTPNFDDSRGVYSGLISDLRRKINNLH